MCCKMMDSKKKVCMLSFDYIWIRKKLKVEE